uniref:cellulase n=1 Tax=Prorocentrum donghaiense TaxID=257771 RepID=A0A220T1H3_9DINO|nr:cellulase [Prorocentrum donghaiense]
MQLVRAIACLPAIAVAQLPGATKEEQGPPIVIAECTLMDGCKAQQRAVTMDANWRWTHGQTCQGTGPGAQCSTSGNCYTDGTWDATMCPDPKSCAENCALEGITLDDYDNTYGVTAVPGGVELGFVRGPNVGSRLYVLEKPNKYKLFKLLNKEFTFDVDVSTLPCGLNGALYFSEMEEDGGMKDAGNKAGAKFGTGYCDAQCPHDVKFMKGESNTLEWNTSAALGKYGLCCAEVDIWEANSMATAFTMHPCTIDKTHLCKGKECGDNAKNERYDGVCDKDGCDFNSYRNGDVDFFGPGSKFTVDTTKPMTVVTQFITDDSTDEGDLIEVRRLYVQSGKVIQNSRASILGPDGGDSINEAYCAAQKRKFNDTDDFRKKGALRRTGEALRRGMTLVLSLWDDWECQMLWLDSDAGTGNHSTPGVARGPCATTTGVPADVRAQYPDASVTYYNIMYGEIGSTYTASDDAKPDKVEATGFAATASVATGPSPGDASAASESDGATGILEGISQTLLQSLGVQQKEMQAQDASGQTPVPAPVPAQGADTSAGGCAGAYQQCDGTSLSRPRCCQAGCDCKNYGDPSYSQCVPPNGAGQCPSAAQERGLVQRSSLREAAALRAGSSASRWAAPSAIVLWFSAPALLLAIAAAAVLVRARGAAWSLVWLRYEPTGMVASAE